MIAQKIADILYQAGYRVYTDSEGGYMTLWYEVTYEGERVMNSKGAKAFKEWFKIMDERYQYSREITKLSAFDLKGHGR